MLIYEGTCTSMNLVSDYEGTVHESCCYHHDHVFCIFLILFIYNNPHLYNI